jgi:hypothetical protein
MRRQGLENPRVELDRPLQDHRTQRPQPDALPPTGGVDQHQRLVGARLQRRARLIDDQGQMTAHEVLQ